MTKETKVTKEFIKRMKKFEEKPEGKGLLEACSENVVLFSKYMLGFELYAWQIDFLTRLQDSLHADRPELLLRTDLYGTGLPTTRDFAGITSRQIGKEQPYSAKIMTPKGWTTMGEIKAGDTVFSADGTQTKVLDTFEQGVKDVYKLTFTDGSSAECGIEHLWKVKRSGNKHWKVENLQTIIDKGGMNPVSDKAIRIPLAKPLEFNKKKLSINPYVLGALLGDGAIGGEGVRFTTADLELLDYIKDFEPSLKINHIDKYDYSLLGTKIGKNSEFINRLRSLKLYGTNSHTKFIPEEYLYGSVEQRIELLRGLMDTDGSIYGKCQMEYYSVNKVLAEQVKHLVQSLGGTATIKEKILKDGHLSYRVKITRLTLNPFKLSRKANKWYKIKYENTRVLKSIELVRQEESKCIMVEHSDHTYITDDFIVTHNTTGVVAIFDLWAAVFNKAPAKVGGNTQVLVVSASDKQSRDLIKYIRRMMVLGDAYMKKHWDYDKFYTTLIDEKGANNTEQITFKSSLETRDGFSVEGTPLLLGSEVGSQIVSFPPTSKVLGSTATIIVVDEVGMTEKISDEFLDEYLSPVGDANDALKVYISTPWVLNGFFYRVIDPDGIYEESGVDKVMYSIDAIAIENPKQYATVMKKIDKMRLDGKNSEVQRAYYCTFVKGEQTFFAPDSVRICFEDDYEMLEEFKGECDLGVDFGGQSISKTVLTISYLNSENVIKRIYKKTYEVGKDDNLIADIEELYKRFNIQRIIPDECPQGDYMIREMIDKGWTVTPMSFATHKVKKYTAFRALLNRGKVKSFKDEGLQKEMFGLEFSQGVRNMMIKHGAGLNDDEIDSFVLSCFHFLVDDTGGSYYDMDEFEDVMDNDSLVSNYNFGW